MFFCYFEMLIRIKDPAKFVVEGNRLQQTNSMLERGGVSEYIYEDWVDATLSLLSSLAEISDEVKALALLETQFNDFVVSTSLVTHLRVRSLPQ